MPVSESFRYVEGFGAVRIYLVRAMVPTYMERLDVPALLAFPARAKQGFAIHFTSQGNAIRPLLNFDAGLPASRQGTSSTFPWD